MIPCIFVSDLHGEKTSYEKLFRYIRDNKPYAVFIGGDILPGSDLVKFRNGSIESSFFTTSIIPELIKLRNVKNGHITKFFFILGNDDPAVFEKELIDADSIGLIHYCHNKVIEFKGYYIAGYNYVPPSPFQLKDWERYDLSRYVDPGCVAPGNGILTVPRPENISKYSTINDDLSRLSETITDHSRCIALFHTPPYRTVLDRAALDGKMIDHAPLDVHVGSIAVKNWIKMHTPYITLHGHIHESTTLTGKWMDIINNTFSFQAAHNGKELSIIIFNPEEPIKAERCLI